MIGSAATTRSPSRVSRSRSTPCVDGCCGPMLRTISAVGRPTPPSAPATSAAPDPTPTVSLRSLTPGSLPGLLLCDRRTDRGGDPACRSCWSVERPAGLGAPLREPAAVQPVHGRPHGLVEIDTGLVGEVDQREGQVAECRLPRLGGPVRPAAVLGGVHDL